MLSSKQEALLETIRKQGQEWVKVRDNLDFLRNAVNEQNEKFQKRVSEDISMITHDAFGPLMDREKEAKDVMNLAKMRQWIITTNARSMTAQQLQLETDAFISFLRRIQEDVADLSDEYYNFLELLIEQAKYKSGFYKLEWERKENMMRHFKIMYFDLIMNMCQEQKKN